MGTLGEWSSWSGTWGLVVLDVPLIHPGGCRLAPVFTSRHWSMREPSVQGAELMRLGSVNVKWTP